MLHVRLFQARTALFQGRARQVILPGEAGEISILDFHAPMLCVLASGHVQIDQAQFSVHGGIARVARNAVTIMAD